MALSQRITQIGEDPYLLELSKLRKTGVHAWPLERRSALPLGLTRTDGPKAGKSRDKLHFFSLKPVFSPSLHVLFKMEKMKPFCPFFSF